jgi:hypothetical protein
VRTTDNAAHTLLDVSSFIPEDGFIQVDFETLAVIDDRTSSHWWKKSRAFLSKAGVVTAGAQQDVADETVGGANGWTLAITAAGLIQGNGNNDVVTWYVFAQVMQVQPAPPTVTSIAPNTGSHLGGTSVVITGKGFLGTVGAAGVTFGGVNATSYTVDSDTQITAVSPVHGAGAVNLVVNTPLGATAPVTFTYT